MPIAEGASFELLCKNIQLVIDEYFSLKAAYLRQSTTAQIRSDLRRGQALFSRLERWMAAAEGNVVQDYVLSGKAENSTPTRANKIVGLQMEE